MDEETANKVEEATVEYQTEIKNLKKEIKVLTERLKDKDEIIRLLKIKE